jgi:hypothetical protein
MMFNSKHKKILLGIFGVLVIVGIIVLICCQKKSQYKIEDDVATVIPFDGPIEIKGMLECLPHIDTTGPQTLECAYGLQDETGRHFAIRDTDALYSNISSVPMNVMVNVIGTFTARKDTTYQSIGTITVTKIAIADVPVRATLSGVYVCLPYKNTKNSQTDECRYGIKTDKGEYYAIDFSLSSSEQPAPVLGEKIRASGVLVAIEQLSTDMWQKYDIKGIFSVTDSFRRI